MTFRVNYYLGDMLLGHAKRDGTVCRINEISFSHGIHDSFTGTFVSCKLVMVVNDIDNGLAER